MQLSLRRVWVIRISVVHMYSWPFVEILRLYASIHQCNIITQAKVAKELDPHLSPLTLSLLASSTNSLKCFTIALKTMLLSGNVCWCHFGQMHVVAWEHWWRSLSYLATQWSCHLILLTARLTIQVNNSTKIQLKLLKYRKDKELSGQINSFSRLDLGLQKPWKVVAAADAPYASASRA